MVLFSNELLLRKLSKTVDKVRFVTYVKAVSHFLVTVTIKLLVTVFI